MVWLLVCVCALLAASGLVYYWINAYSIVMCIYVDTEELQMYLCTSACNNISLYLEYIKTQIMSKEIVIQKHLGQQINKNSLWRGCENPRHQS